jgi:hypothetical protein
MEVSSSRRDAEALESLWNGSETGDHVLVANILDRRAIAPDLCDEVRALGARGVV